MYKVVSKNQKEQPYLIIDKRSVGSRFDIYWSTGRNEAISLDLEEAKELVKIMEKE